MASWTTLAALVVCAAASGGATAALHSYENSTRTGPRCTEFAKLNLLRDTAPRENVVSVQGQQRPVRVYWSAGPARAAAALLLVVLRHQLRYAEPRLAEGPRDLCQLTDLLSDRRLSLVPAAAWKRGAWCPQWQNCKPHEDGFCGLGGPSLMVMREGAAPLSVRVHLYISAAARTRPECTHATSWTFYGNHSVLIRCSFDLAKDSHVVPIYVAVETPRQLPEARALIESIIGTSVRVRFEPLARHVLSDRLRNATSGSFLFLDWDMWQRVPGVTSMDVANHPQKKRDMNIVEVRAATETLAKYALPMFYFTQKFEPEPDDLREIFELEARHSSGDIQEAACQWAINHAARLKKWLWGNYQEKLVMLYVCSEVHHDNSEYNITIHIVGSELWQVSMHTDIRIDIYPNYLNCSDRDNVVKTLDTLTRSTRFYQVIGIAAAREGAAFIAEISKVRHLPLVEYDLNVDGIHTVVGGVADLAVVLRQFFIECGWARIAILSEPSTLARTLVSELGDRDCLITAGRPCLCVHDVQIDATGVTRALRELQGLGARVVLLNMHAELAGLVAAEAVRLGMTAGAGYAWVAREWGGLRLPLRVLAVSGQCRQGRTGAHAALRRRLDEEFRAWPSQAASVADALLTIGHGYLKLQRDHPEYKNDQHGNSSLRLFWEGLAAANLSGVCQSLRFEAEALAERLVYIDEWVGERRESVAVWRVHRGIATPVLPHHAACPAGTRPPHDGRSGCIFKSGDCFQPKCHDMQLAMGAVALVIVLILVALAVVQTRRAFRRWLHNYESEIRKKLPGRREQTSLLLVEYLVSRDQLELRELLGSGCSGRVHLAMLRAPNRKPRAVAAKSLREHAAPSEESELLREACTLAGLDHVHVVRLLGVCIGDPLLVLMEHAFFGDLLGYLRARRHFVGGTEVDEGAEESEVPFEEAVHVSAEALTRLVREAAAALAYLAHHGVVHRDVRAANCLVDARRTLKLGDFGMARETREAGADGEAEYACRRRGMFPVLWMAPESLERGAFSAASDVWSLGVVMLEVVTLGERPYGSWSPMRVLQHVAGGGQPRLPADASAQTRGVVLSCWRRAARERPSASELVAYLADHPRALSPALTSDWEAADVDSGYDGYATDVTDSLDTFGQPSPDSGTAFFLN